MKKICIALIVATLTLASCGNGNTPAPQPAPNPTDPKPTDPKPTDPKPTPVKNEYLGTWTWELQDYDGKAIMKGTAKIDKEVKDKNLEGGSGSYSSTGDTKGIIQVGKFLSSKNIGFNLYDSMAPTAKVYIRGTDYDNKLEEENGNLVLKGAGEVLVNGKTVDQKGVFIMTRTSAPK